MACCGQKRMAAGGNRHETTGRPTGRMATGVGSTPGRPGDVVLRYRGAGPFSTRSPISGRAYGCARIGAGLATDPRDVAMLVRTGLFERLHSLR